MERLADVVPMGQRAQQQDGEDFFMLSTLFGVGVASLCVAPPLYDASDLRHSRWRKSDFARYDAYLYTSGVDGEKSSI